MTSIEPMQKRTASLATELPYMVNKARLIEKIAELVRIRKSTASPICGMSPTVRGMRICIELRRDVNPNVVLNLLGRKHTASGIRSV